MLPWSMRLGGATEKIGFVSQKNRGRFLPLLPRQLAKANAWSTTVRVDELDAGGFKRAPNDLPRRSPRFACGCLELMNRQDRDVLSQFMPQCRAELAHWDGFPRQFVEVRTTRPTPN
jgi:hypothetical protein